MTRIDKSSAVLDILFLWGAICARADLEIFFGPIPRYFDVSPGTSIMRRVQRTIIWNENSQPLERTRPGGAIGKIGICQATLQKKRTLRKT